MAANCHEFADYANLIGINSSCKMRWTGQWPGTATGQQQPLDLQQQQNLGAIGTDDAQNVIGMDQLHQHIQQQLCSEQFHFLSQLQVCLSSICSVQLNLVDFSTIFRTNSRTVQCR